MFSKRLYYPDPGNRRFPRTPLLFVGNPGNYIIIYYNYNKLSITPTKMIKGGFVQGNCRFPGILYKFNEIIKGTLKKSEKEMGSLLKIGHFKNVHFSKCDY